MTLKNRVMSSKPSLRINLTAAAALQRTESQEFRDIENLRMKNLTQMMKKKKKSNYQQCVNKKAIARFLLINN